MSSYPGRYPATVRAYDGDSRTCRVEIPGVTDGGDMLPSAEIEYPIGDRSKGQNPTEIEFLDGDPVWVAFIGGDERYPIITGYRNATAGNSVDWRRFHHENIELLAKDVANVIAGGDVLVKSGTKATINGPVIHLKTETSMSGAVQGDCICAFTGAPHGHVSSTVKVSK
jgi:hypothetical protein